MTWFYDNEGEAQGPLEEEAMISLVQSGRLQAESLVWHNALELWEEAGKLCPGWWGPVADMPMAKSSSITTGLATTGHRSPVPLAPTQAPVKKKAGLLNRLFGRKE